MKINRHNFELFFLDYYDHQLSPSDAEMLFEFLKSNPDLKEEFDRFEMISIENSSSMAVFPLKEQLKRPEIINVGEIDESNYQEYFISWHEGDLLPEKQIEVLSFINSNPQLDEEFELFGKIKLQPDLIITFTSKQKLIQTARPKIVRLYFQYAVSAAAILALVFTVFQQLNHTKDKNFQQAGLSIKHSDNNFTNRHNNQTAKFLDSEPIILSHNNYHNTPKLPRMINEPAPSRISSISASNIPEYTNNSAHHRASLRYEFSDAYAAMTEKQKSAPAEENSPFILQPRLFDNIVNQIEDNYDNTTDKLANISGWSIAKYGVMGFNILTDNDVAFNVQSNDQGEVSKVAFNDFAFPIKKNR